MVLKKVLYEIKGFLEILTYLVINLKLSHFLLSKINHLLVFRLPLTIIYLVCLSI